MDRRWGFEEADDEEFDDRHGGAPRPAGAPPQPTGDTENLIIGQDADQVVTVGVTDTGDVASVRLARDWRSSIDPRVLHSSVLSALTAATVQAVAREAEKLDMSGADDAGTGDVPDASDSAEDETPITREYAMQLLSTVSSDVEGFMREATSITTQVVTTQSTGGHVTVSGMRRQVSELSIEPRFAQLSGNGVIESELTEALGSFQAQSAIGELARGPQSPAITELMNMVANPQSTLRRINNRTQS